KGIGAECIYVELSEDVGTKDILLSFGEKKNIIDKPAFLLIVAGDSIFEGKENISVNEEIKDFVEKAKELIENKGAKVVWGVIPQENYKGGEKSLKAQTKCVVDENRVISARKNCEPKEGEKLFASLIFARADILFRLIKRAKDVHGLYEIKLTHSLIEEGLYAIVLENILYINVNDYTDLKKWYALLEEKRREKESIKEFGDKLRKESTKLLRDNKKNTDKLCV
ncbi:MAG: hypothetical protein ACP5O8_04285, partial [Candidatus Aenigmatarchaeota archaeon]